MATRTATRYECRNNLSVLCTRGDGRPTRKTCVYCGGELRVETGVWGVFDWTQANRYPAEAANRAFPSRKQAEACADADNLVSRCEGKRETQVVRWIDARAYEAFLAALAEG
jgi:hypothetical protein